MKDKKILFLTSNILGNKTMTVHILDALKAVEGFTIDTVIIEGCDYRNTPSLVRKSNLAECIWVADRKIQQVDVDQYDIIVLGCFEHVLAMRKYLSKKPTILFHDTTPVAARRMLAGAHSSLLPTLKSKALIHLYRFIFRRLFKKVAYFVPRTPWCGKSLVEDFGVDPGVIKPSFAVIDFDRWKKKVAYSPDDAPLRYLFVGNDFYRKGGKDLLAAWESECATSCELTIVSNDASLNEADLPSGVKLLRDVPHDDMPEVYQSADVFVFPTQRDQLGLVSAEAMACGLPVLARAVGGLPDIVKNGWNGRLLDYDSTAEDWARALMELSRSRKDVERMGLNARAFAEEHFCKSNFNRLIRNTIERVRPDQVN